MADVRVGISGWTYPPWRGNFYPEGLPQSKELAYASRRFNALEINGTFYSLQKPASFASWHAQTPDGFLFAVKGTKYVTHERRLKDVEGPLCNFFASGVLALKEKLGPFLWQFAPNMKFDEERFRAFFALLPRDTRQLAELARRRDDWMEERSFIDADALRPVRHAVEFRHESFLSERFVSLLREFNVSMVAADAASNFPSAEDLTADFVYVRLHGARKMHESGYTPAEIEEWAGKIERWRAGGEPADARRIVPAAAMKANAPSAARDMYVFFDNTEVKERSPVNARAMAERLGVAPPGDAEALVEELRGGGRAAGRRSPPKPRAGPVSSNKPAGTPAGEAPPTDKVPSNVARRPRARTRQSKD